MLGFVAGVCCWCCRCCVLRDVVCGCDCVVVCVVSAVVC